MTERVKQRQYLSRNSVLPAWSVSFRDDPSCPIGVREDLAKNMVAEVAVRDEQVRNDFDRVSIFNRPIFNATWNDSKCCWEDFVEKGEEGFTLTPKGKGREVVYRCQPFWYRLEMGEGHGPVFVSVAANPLEGYTLAPMFKNGTDYVFRPSFELALDLNGTPHSRAGLKPIERSAPELMSTVRSYSANARTETMAEWFSDYLLLLVEFGRRDLQSVMYGYCSQLLYLDIYHGTVDGKEVISFSTYGELPCNVNEQCLFCYSDYREENPEKKRLVTLYSATDLGDGTYLVDLGLSNIDELIQECADFALYSLPMNTGSAMSTVTSATSGTAGRYTGEIASIVWRGKENPWGNAGSLMCDMIFETKRGSIYLPYHLNDISHFDGTINEHYSACHSKGYYLPSTGLHFITGFLQSNPPHVLIPSEVSTHSPEKYWSTAMFVENTGVGSINFLRTGGNSRSGICANHGTFEILSGEMVGEAFGGRLVLDGGMS